MFSCSALLNFTNYHAGTMTKFSTEVRLLFCALLCLGLASTANADRSKKALKSLEEGSYSEALEDLEKSVEKDSINTSAYYVYALLYSTSEFSEYDVDTAHHFVLRSLKDHERSDEKQLKELEKLERGLNDIALLKVKIDSLGFEEALSAHTIERYEHFMELYPSANQFETAVNKRNALVYANVTQVHTWQAYQQFFEDYPDALEVSDARALYEQLLFEEKTTGNTLAAFTQFLKEFPSTPYRKKAELRILQIMAADNSATGLTSFLEVFPQSDWNRQAVNRLYQLNKSSANASFLKYFDPYEDSLARSSRLDGIPLLTIYEDKAYGFINYAGQEVYPPKYQTVYEDYLCGEIRSDYLLVSDEGLPKIINRTGTTIYEGSYETVEDLGVGFLLVSTENELLVVHKSGEIILKGNYDEIEFPNHQFFVIYQNNKAGLASVFGEVLVQPTYDDIYTEGSFWVIEQDRRFAVAAVDQLAQIADRKPFTPEFKYDDVELLRDQYLFVAMDDFEAILDTDFSEIVPWRNHQISPMPSGWLLKQPFGYRILQDADEEENLQLYEDVRYNSAWIAIKQDEKWSVFPKTLGGEPNTNLDTINLVGESSVFLGSAGGNSLIFSNGSAINLESDQIVNVISAREQDQSAAKEYFLVKNRTACVVYNAEGKKLFLERIDNVSYLAPGFFEIAWKGKKGIIKENGLVVQKAEHDAIGLVGDKVALILDGGKFGYYHLDSRKTISPRYSQRLEAYNTNYLIAAQGNKMGIINGRDGDEVTGFWYEDVSYWTDSTALVKQEDQYQVINIESGEAVMSGIRKVSQLLKTPDEIVLSVLSKDGFGIMSNKHGEILPPLYNDIVNLGTVDNPVYFAEQHLPRAEFYVVTYSDRYGKVIRSQAFRTVEYDKIYCEE